MRRESGLTQRELAEHLGRERSFVSRVEQGERRVDVVEFYWICCACGVDPSEAAVSLMADFDKLKRKARRGNR